MRYDAFVQEVCSRTGLERGAAELAIGSCLRALGQVLSELPARSVRAQLPPEVQPWLRRDGPAADLSAEAFFALVARFEDVRVGVAVEHAEVVLLAVHRALDDGARRLLREDLPQALLDVAAASPTYHRPEPRPIPTPTATRRTSSGTSLAEGRAGSWSPLSEAGVQANRPGRRRAEPEDDD